MKVLIYLIAILATAKLGAEIFERMKQPAVLGELIAGVILGNLVLVSHNWNFFEPMRSAILSDHAAVNIDMLAKLGIIILLFEVGLESSVRDMRRIGFLSFFVATVGVAATFVLGYLVSTIFVREVPSKILAASPNFDVRIIHVFIGATLCATSVGITARVFRDLGRSQLNEARVVLGAAVVDDVLSLIMLAAVSAIVTSNENGAGISSFVIAKLTLIAVGFLAGALVIGSLVIPHLVEAAAKFRTRGLMLITALVICFGLASLAGMAGLAPIVGAFAAGLVLEEVHFRNFGSDIGIKNLLGAVSTLLVPIFFVQMGVQVHLESFLNPSVIGISMGLIVAAVLGKQACGFIVGRKGIDRLVVGIGMIPRGEVELIFAGIGKSLGIINDEIFSAIVVTVMVTTFVTPPLLKWSIGRARKPEAANLT
ncbi:MAG TPA: cation:proton antiporter [Candidatus Acidoferrales bacterium]|nr:cation:proton antiporter [Candidatus Acidoferrales bacterium]